MARSVSNAFKIAVFSQQTDEVFAVLLTITHEDLPSPLRFTTDSVDTVSRGNTYLAYPFMISLPNDSPDTPPQVQLTIDNIDRTIVAAIRELATTPYVTMEVVKVSDADVVEASFRDFRMSKITYDALTVVSTLGIEGFTAEPYPAGSFNPGNFPGLFGTYD